MQLDMWNLVRSMTGIETGRNCRRCDEPLERRDGFAMSEAICAPCRIAAE